MAVPIFGGLHRAALDEGRLDEVDVCSRVLSGGRGASSSQRHV